jgi:HK97 family phage major capsid protein
MNIGTSTDGGYLVPVGHFRDVIARRDEMMLANSLGVRLIPGVGTTVNVPVDNEEDGEFVATSEQNDAHSNNFDRDAPALDQVAMTLTKYSKKVELTDELLQDNDSNLNAFLADWVGRGMAKTHNSLLLTEVLANGTAALTFDSATAIGAAEVPELVYTLQQDYEDGAAWIMRRTTEGHIRGKIGDAFQFAPSPGGELSRRSLWGFPSYVSQYAGALAASGKSLVFGNFRYVGRRDGPSLTLLRDPYSVDGLLVLKYFFRTVYKVLQAEAIRIGTHPTA